jgi:hypothetical protein
LSKKKKRQSSTPPVKSGSASGDNEATNCECKGGDTKHSPYDKINTGVACVGLAVLIVYTWFSGCESWEMKKGNNIATQDFTVSQRAYVSLGGEPEKLADFQDVPGRDKPIVVLHFFNSGSSVARHFAVTASTSSRTIEMDHTPSVHRHRFRIPDSDNAKQVVITTEGLAIVGLSGQMRDPSPFFNLKRGKPPKKEDSDVPAKASRRWSITDSRWLLSRTQLQDTKEYFTIFGEFEYCDIFGDHHCAKIVASYFPPPVDDFIQSAPPSCFIETINPRDIGLPDGAFEIDPCEQPNESDYQRQSDLPL